MPMFRRTQTAGDSGGADAELAFGATGSRPDVPGGLDSLLSTAPCFRPQVRGYDRLQVDNYVAWAESELATARRQFDHLLARFGECSAELEISRRLLAEAPRGVDLSPVSDRMREMLRLASDEAAAMTEAAREEAEHLLAEARVEADARLRKAHQIKELAADTADTMLEQARSHREEATTLLERARAEAAELVGSATAERERLTGEAAEAHERLAGLQAEVADLRRQQDEARTSLRLLTDRIGQALSVVTGGPPDQYLLIDNRVADERVEAMSSSPVAG
jgi:cell division septum initiation protein DivIVA